MVGLKAHRARASSEPGFDNTSLDASKARVSAGMSEVVTLVPRSVCPHASEAGVLDSSPCGGTCPNAGTAGVKGRVLYWVGLQLQLLLCPRRTRPCLC